MEDRIRDLLNSLTDEQLLLAADLAHERRAELLQKRENELGWVERRAAWASLEIDRYSPTRRALMRGEVEGKTAA